MGALLWGWLLEEPVSEGVKLKLGPNSDDDDDGAMSKIYMKKPPRMNVRDLRLRFEIH